MQRPLTNGGQFGSSAPRRPGPGERDWVPCCLWVRSPNPGLGVLDRGFGESLSPSKEHEGPSDSGQKLGKGGGALQVVRYLISLSTPRFQICSSKRPQAHCAARTIYLDLEEVDWGKLELL